MFWGKMRIYFQFIGRAFGMVGILFVFLNVLSTEPLVITASDVGTEIKINTPVSGQIVRGTNVDLGITLGPDVFSIQLSVDGSTAPLNNGKLTWNSTTATDGKHTLTIRVFQRGGTASIGEAWILIVVRNSAMAAPVQHFPTLPSTPPPHRTAMLRRYTTNAGNCSGERAIQSDGGETVAADCVLR